MPPIYTASEARSIQRMFAAVAPAYDLANLVMSAGLDHLWRREVSRQVGKWNPRTLLDVATGSGVLAAEIQRQNPTTRIIGADFCAPMLTAAKRRGFESLVVADALALPFKTGSFDVVTVAFGLRNMASWKDALLEMGRVLRTGGNLLVLDFSQPSGLVAKPYRFYMHRMLPVIAGLITGEPAAYNYLAGSVETFPSGEEMLQLFRSCGYVEVNQKRLAAGIVTLYFGAKPG